MAFKPGQIWRYTPIGILTNRWTTNAEIVVATVGPVRESNQQAIIFIDIAKAQLIKGNRFRPYVDSAGWNRRRAGQHNRRASPE